MRRRPDPAAAIAAVHDQVPAIACRGLCHDSCGPIRMTRSEHDTIRVRHGIDIPTTGIATCPALTILNRCAVHEDRPTVCRLWGVVDPMRCPHGCEPDRVLTAGEGYELLAQAAHADGDRAEARQFRNAARAVAQ